MKIYRITRNEYRKLFFGISLILLISVNSSGVNVKENTELDQNQSIASATIYDFFIYSITQGEHLAQLVIYVNHTNTEGHLNITFEFVQNDVSLEVMDILVQAEGAGTAEVRALISPRVSGNMNVTATVLYKDEVQDTFIWLWENFHTAYPEKLRAFAIADQYDLDNNSKPDTLHTRLYYSYFNAVNTNVTIKLRIYRFGYPDTFNGVLITRNHTGNGNDVVSFNITMNESANYQFEWEYLADGVHVDWVTESYALLKYWGDLGNYEINHSFIKTDHSADVVAQTCSDTYSHTTNMNYTQVPYDKFILAVMINVFDEIQNDYTTGTGKGKNYFPTSENGTWTFEAELLANPAGKYRIRTTIEMIIGSQSANEYMNDIFIDNTDECVFSTTTNNTTSTSTTETSSSTTTTTDTPISSTTSITKTSTTTPVSDTKESTQNDTGASVSIDLRIPIFSLFAMIFIKKRFLKILYV